MTTSTMSHSSPQHEREVSSGQRFQFGKNWANFLHRLDDERIAVAKKSLCQMLKTDSLAGKSFLDIGSGSGLFSLAARSLGASVHSFDFDPQSVACAQELKRRYFPDDESWVIEEGSALDREYIQSLGCFDIVYAWGVLHHTGDMWKALEHAQLPVVKGGSLFIAIYNDEGRQSERWKRIKQLYCSGTLGRWYVLAVFLTRFFFAHLWSDIRAGRNPYARYRDYKQNRGMSLFHDWIDWLGGYPFEWAKAEEIFEFYQQRGFRLTALRTVNNHGNNHFVFLRE